LVRAGYVEFDKPKDSYLGVPQGGIVSPILSNLYLHELDLYVEKLINKQNAANKGVSPTRKNPEYDKVMSKINGINRTEKR
jgi:retron-type reverse transcriptase